jgi:hypothetical protein
LECFLGGGGECGGLVVVLAGGQAVVEAADHAAEQVALGGGVPVAGVAAAEDLSPGQSYQGVQVRNPFLAWQPAMAGAPGAYGFLNRPNGAPIWASRM